MCHLPSTHTCTYTMLGPRFLCGFLLEHELQDRLRQERWLGTWGVDKHLVGAVGYIPPSRGQQCLTVYPKPIPIFRDRARQIGDDFGTSSVAPRKWGYFLYKDCVLISTEEHRKSQSPGERIFREQRSNPLIHFTARKLIHRLPGRSGRVPCCSLV